MKPTTSLEEQSQSREMWQDAVRRFAQNRLAVVGLIIIILLISATVLAPLIAPYPYDKQNYSAVGENPSWAHPMGTDSLGRDVFSRVLYGGRVSISIGVLVQISALIVGIPLGAWGGYYGGKVDYVVCRLIDVMSAFPSLLLAILLLVMVGPGYGNVLFAMAVVEWPRICRLIRGQFLELRGTEFVLAARSIGASDRRIILKHLLPNSLSPIIVAFTLGISTAIFREAGLSFIGIGIVPPTPSWGQMVGDHYLKVQTSWWLPTFPALALGLAILAFTVVGDGLQEAISPWERR